LFPGWVSIFGVFWVFPPWTSKAVWREGESGVGWGLVLSGTSDAGGDDSARPPDLGGEIATCWPEAGVTVESSLSAF
jgi:hypothetical protein